MAGLVIAAALLSACTPAPEPTPTASPAFASEEEAFAAAEETYRAYIQAVNSEHDGAQDGSSLRFLTGEILEAEIANARDLDAAGIHIEGETKILEFNSIEAELGPPGEVKAQACLDISNARAINQAGEDVTTPGRSDLYAVTVTFVGTRSSLLISAYEVSVGVQC